MKFSTRAKIRIAHHLFRVLRAAGVRTQRDSRRQGVTFSLDLREGMDLAVFLFGGFQGHTTRYAREHLDDNSVLIDVGCNAGYISLPLMEQLPHAQLHAFDPTDYAAERFKRNLELNPELAQRVSFNQTFVTDGNATGESVEVYSSWRVDSLAGERHETHLGIPCKAENRFISLDQYVKQQGIDRVDFLKIDTDGAEFSVLAGAENVLRNYRPFVVFEIALYELNDRGTPFVTIDGLLRRCGYEVFDAKSMRVLDVNTIEKVVPEKGSIDALALPSGAFP